MKQALSIDGKPVLRLRSGLEIRVGDVWAGIALIVAAIVFSGFSINIGVTQTGFVDLLETVIGGQLGDDQTLLGHEPTLLGFYKRKWALDLEILLAYVNFQMASEANCSGAEALATCEVQRVETAIHVFCNVI